jgi:class 3 adenylate cyclase
MFTFLFTDIEGSTALWEQEPQAMRVALVRHNAILRQICEICNGHVFKTLGDGFCIAFTDAARALQAAITAQRMFDLEPWPPSTPIRVRMALYTGNTAGADSDYLGPVVNRVARMRDAGHGGQILLSLSVMQSLGLTPETTEAMLGPERIRFVDYGEQHFKGVMHGERVFQVVATGLKEEFPALRPMALDEARADEA